MQAGGSAAREGTAEQAYADGQAQSREQELDRKRKRLPGLNPGFWLWSTRTKITLIPISRVHSSTVVIMVLAMPTAATSSAMPPIVPRPPCRIRKNVSRRLSRYHL